MGQRIHTDEPEPQQPGRGVAAKALRAGWLSRRTSSLLYQVNHFAGLATRALGSLKRRGLTTTLRIIGNRLFPAPRQPYTLELYPDIGESLKFRFPTWAGALDASVVVPVHNQLEYTMACLASLALSGDSRRFEVIVVDDASDDASSTQLPQVEGLRYLRNAQNLGFVGSCNAGAAIARGEFLVFLNNDTVVQPGWLDRLLQTFADHPDTGIAGSKLVYPDGRLQEAGGIVFADGSAANYGRFGDPSDPRYNFVREADYCSGAAIAVPRKLFETLEGFDAHYRPAYYEDTDLAMRVRRAGLKARYQPASVVVHFEGISSGTDVRRGVKSYQALNHGKFVARWADDLARAHPAPVEIELPGPEPSVAANHRALRQVLIVDSYTPTPDRDSGSVRMLGLMKLLLDEGCSVTFFGQSGRHDGAYSEALQQMGVEVWWQPWIGNVADWLELHGPRFDAVIASRHYVLSPLLPVLRKFLPQAQLVFDTVDLHFLREQREAAQTGDANSLRTAANTRESELRLMRAVDRTWVVSEVERALLTELIPGAAIDVVSNIHSVVPDSRGFNSRSGICFVGGFRHPPNVDAALWLARDIFPRILSALPDVELHLVGADMPDAIDDLGAGDAVRAHGHVPDLDAFLDERRVSVAPLRYGAGVKGKVNHSLARGLPVVATTCATEGMFLQNGVHVLVADDAQDFADAVVRLYRDQALWETLRAGGLDNTQKHFSIDAARAVIQPWVRNLSTRA